MGFVKTSVPKISRPGNTEHDILCRGAAVSDPFIQLYCLQPQYVKILSSYLSF